MKLNTPPLKNTRAPTPPSTCISSKRRPPASTSKNTGGNAIGTEADASMICWKRRAASGRPLAAISPMFQTQTRCESRSAVAMYSRRPPLCAAAIRRSSSASTCRSIISRSGPESASDSPPRSCGTIDSIRKMLSDEVVV